MTFDEGIPIFNLHEIHSGFAGVLAGHKKDHQRIKQTQRDI